MSLSLSGAPGSAAAVGAALNPLIQIRDLIYKIAGIFQADNKLRLLEDRCQKRMKMLGVPSLRDYFDCLTIKPIRQTEMVSLLNEITIGETCFFRNRPQIDAIRNIVLPKSSKRSQSSLCGSFAFGAQDVPRAKSLTHLQWCLLEEQSSRLKGWTVEILATDLNERSIAHAKAGSYGDYSTRNIEPLFRGKYFLINGDKLKVKPDVHSAVSFSRLNLLDDACMLFITGVDLILCCNVLIYFDAISKKRVIQHFYTNLLQHGYLFLGHSESLFGVTDEFRLVHLPSCTAYVKSEKRIADQSR